MISGSTGTRAASKIEILYKTRHGQPNGLALTDNPGRMWIVDQGAEHWISLIDIQSGDTLREFQADVVGPSGLVQDGQTMWITSTHNSLIVHCDLHGKTIAKYVTPGAGRIFEREDDPKPRSSPLKPAWPDKPRAPAHAYPRPTNGILVAITVMNSTLASSGRLAMWSTASATRCGSITGSTAVVPFACGTPLVIAEAISVSALPMSICPQAMSKGRPSSASDLVRPVMACFVAV